MARRSFPPRIVRLLAAAALAGCGGGEARVEEARPSAAPDSSLAAAGAPADSGCRKEGLWAPCSVEDRLEAAGLVIERKPEPASYDFLSVPGTAYKVGAGDDELQVFLYPTEAARRTDTDRLDSATVSPRGTRRSYRVPPLLVTSNNLAAIVFTQNERSQERMSLALSAGLPQPRSRP